MTTLLKPSVALAMALARGALVALTCLILASCGSLTGNTKQSIVDSAAVRNLLNQAIAAEEGGDTVQAATLFEQMMQRGARSAKSLNRYAVFQRRQLNIEEAEQLYLHALKNEPDHINTHYNLGILYELYRGDLNKAQKHYKKYLAGADADQTDQRLVKAWLKDIDRRMAQAASNPESGG